MTGKLETEGKRQPYVRPQLEQVELVPEEAVLSSCKSQQGGPGPHNINCRGISPDIGRCSGHGS